MPNIITRDPFVTPGINPDNDNGTPQNPFNPFLPLTEFTKIRFIHPKNLKQEYIERMNNNVK